MYLLVIELCLVDTFTHRSAHLVYISLWVFSTASFLSWKMSVMSWISWWQVQTVRRKVEPVMVDMHMQVLEKVTQLKSDMRRYA